MSQIGRFYVTMSVPLFISLYPPLNCPLWVKITLSF